MKFYILLSILIGLSTCGHIYVSDTQLHYQNTGYLTSAQLYFKLDTDLFQNEVLKIVWPYTFNVTTGPIILSIYTTLSTTALSTGTAITDATTKAYLIRIGTKLNAQQWYILNISSVAQSPIVQFYTIPIQMSTHSGMTVAGLITDYLMYDYNTACGFIAVAPAPSAISSVILSDTETGLTVPSNAAEKKYLDAIYPVYITILTTGDYEYGGTFYFKITDGFTWSGSCEALSKTCVDTPDCITVQALSATSDYTCTVTDNLLTFKRYQNSSKLSINHQGYMRIKVSVKNPSILATGGVNIQLVSNYANYIYEVLDKVSLFQTATITLGTGDALFLWGLVRNLAETKGCPIRIYFTQHTGIAVWNRISLPFYPLITLPGSNQGFYIQVDVKAASIINDLSIYTDAVAFGSNAITCASDASNAVEKYILCRNVGQLIINQVKYIKFAFIVDAADYADATEFASFGSITIFNQEFESAITGSVIPTNLFDSIKNNVMYTPDAQGNAVMDMVAPLAYGFTPMTTYFAVTARDGDIPAGRSSIRYTNAETNLFFPITTTFATQCCDGYDPTNQHDCPDQLNDECKTITIAGTYGSTLILKMLSNKHALSLSLTDQDFTVAAETNVFKGVELYPSISGLPRTPGMFGMDDLINDSSTNELLCLADKSDLLTKICSTFSKYVNYYDAKSTTATLYLYNQWFSTADSWELHTVCWAGHAGPLKQVCGAAENVNKGVLIRHVTLTVVANTLYPQQTDLDFIMCFRYAPELSTTLGKDGTTKLATSSLINAQIINCISPPSQQVSSSGTMLKIGFLNYFNEALNTDHAVNYIPTLLRIGGYMQAAEVTSNNGLAFFFDGDNIVITESKLSANMPLIPTDCASSLVSGIVCRYFKSRLVNSNTPTGGLHKDYYPGLNAIIMGGSTITGSVEFNYYIPVWIKVPAFTFAFFGLINNYATFPTVTSVYKIYGTVENAQTAGDEWKSYAVAGAVAHTIATYWINQATTGLGKTILNSEADWEIDGPTLGVFNTYSDSSVTKDLDINKLAYSSSAAVYPGDVATAAIIDASFDSGSTAAIDFFNDDTIMMITAQKIHTASLHFMVNSQIKYWSGDLVWSLTNISTPFSARCVDMAISSFYDSTHNQIQYLIICPYEGKLATGNSMVSVFPTLTIASWTWPDYYGTDTFVGVHLRYLWTDRLGNLKGYLAERKQGITRPDCVLGTGTEVFAITTLQKKAQIKITPFNSIALLPATTASKEKEKIKINLIVSSATTSTLPTPKCSSGLSSVKCSVIKEEKTFSFTLSNADTVNAQTIPNSQVTLTFWLDSTGLTQETFTYTAQIYAYFYKKYTLQENAISSLINDCSSQAAWTSGPKENRIITVSDPNHDIMVIGARTPFSFSFSSDYTVIDASKFTINLAFLATANSNLISNLRCAIYSGSTISHLFDKFTYSALIAVEFEYKEQDTALQTATEIGNVSYKFLCNGGEVISNAPSAASKINVQNILSSTIGDGYCAEQSTAYTSLRNASSATIANFTLAKTFSQAGQDSTYTFNVKVAPKTVTSETNVVTTTIRFLAGSQFFIEFARDISPRFNKLGIIRCYHEEIPTYCKYESERRISLILITDLNHDLTYGHNLSIVGIQRPFNFENYKKIYVALVPYLGTFNDLEFQDSTSVEDAATTDSVVNTLPVVYYSQNIDNTIRSTYSLTMHIKFPAVTVSETIPIWVDFPEDSDEAMFLGWTPSCQFNNVKIHENDTISNYVNSCALNSNRRVKFNMKTDSNNTNTKLYALTISGIPVDSNQQYYLNLPIVWFGNAANITVPLYKTNLGYFNGTSNLKTFNFIEESKQLLTWDINTLECYIGTYHCTAKLQVKDLENFSYDIPSFTSTGIYSDLFSFNPRTLAVQTGKAYTQFEIVPKASTAPGLYQLQWNHGITNYYSAIPPLNIIALNSQISIDAISVAYEVPNGGKSLPIIFDFAGKMPETDITIEGVAKSLEINSTTYITSKYVSFQVNQKTVKFAENSLSSQIQFVVTGKTVTGTNEPAIPSAILSWTLSGTNAKSYSNPSNVTVTVVAAQVGTPELTLNTNNSVGLSMITAKCSQASTLYYVVSQDQNATQIQVANIKASSEDLNIMQTGIGSVLTNPQRTLYGYYFATNSEVNYTIIIKEKLQSEATYYLRAYCVNQMETAGVAKYTTWKQSSNGGKPLISALTFYSTNTTNTQDIVLTNVQVQEVTCIICSQANVEKDKVFGTNGITCDENLTIVANTTTNSTVRLLATTANSTEYFVVMPDLFVSDGSLSTVKTTLESAAFSNALSASTILAGLTLNSITCSINSNYPSTPLISSPVVSPAENSITFTWTGANNTDGFIFVGVTEQTNETVEPTAVQLKKNLNYTFTAFNKAFYSKNTIISVILSPITKCLDYKYYWVATNEDPETYQYTTQVQSGNTKLKGCSIFASVLSRSIIFILLFFVLLLI